MKVSPLPGDAVLFLNHLVESFRPLAIRNQIYLHFGSNPTSIQALLDYQMMETILSNLISNSIKYCTSGDIIHVSLVMEKQVLIWIVSDTGKGIATEELPHIFDPFFRAQSEERNEIEGSGIGLALVKDLIALMGGTIQAKSKPGLGTSFVCTIPYVPVTNLVMEETNVSFTPELVNDTLLLAEQPDEEKAEILIVEDNPEMSMFLHMALQKAYNVHLAANGQEGFGLALAHTPDLIITDAMMPEMDGFEFTRMVKDDIRVSHVPVIMLTAKTGLEHLMESLDSGVDAFMTKPFRLDELLLRVKKLLELRKILRYKWSGTSDQKHEDSNKNHLPEREALFLQEVRHIILDHLAEPELKGDFIGKKLGMSRMNLHRKLKSLIDMPVTDLIRDIRLEEASKILLSGNFHIAEVAYQTGFSSPALFTTSFKAKFGKAPSDWVKESQSK